MKDVLLLGAWALGVPSVLMAGGVFSNSNQSAEYLRTFDRNSAIDGADSACYNPAGTVRLPEGLCFNLSNQTIFQRATVATRGNPVLGDRTYRSGNPVWGLPNLHGVYRKGRWAFYLGLGTPGATAVREWPDGLPTLDLLGKRRVGYGGAASWVLAGDAYDAALRAGGSPAEAQAAATAAGLDGAAFQARSYLKGASQYLAWRGGVACLLTPRVSAALTGRVVAARQELVGQVDAVATGNGPDPDFRQGSRLLLHGTDRALGWSGEAGLNFFPGPDLVFSVTYETATRLAFRTRVHDGQDGGGLLVDGRRARLDLPGALRLGLGWQMTDRIRASLGWSAYLEKSADFSLLAWPGGGYDPRRQYGNTFEEAGALEYRVSPAWLWSAGVNFNQIGQAKAATLDTSAPGAHADYLSLGAGFRVQATERLRFNLGVGHTRFKHPYERADGVGDAQLRERFAAQGVAIQPRKLYDKRYLVLALGFEYRFD